MNSKKYLNNDQSLHSELFLFPNVLIKQNSNSLSNSIPSEERIKLDFHIFGLLNIFE